MTSQVPFTPLTGEALDRLTLDERMAFEAAAMTVASDQKPSLEVIATLMLAVQRLTGEAAVFAGIRVSATGAGRVVATRPDDGRYAAKEIRFACGQSRSLAEIAAAFERSSHLGEEAERRCERLGHAKEAAA